MEDARTSIEWLDREDAAARADRLSRLDWMAKLHTESSDYLVQGGRESIQLFDEARYCYVYGQYLATTILGVAFVERIIAARFYMSGRNDLERAGGLDLLRAAVDEGWMTDSEFYQFDRMRRLRNPLAHFRRPLAADTVTFRAVEENRHFYEILEKDAQDVLEGALHVLKRYAFFRS
jgi:hypothetical protein